MIMTLNQLKNKRPTIAVLTNMMATPFSEGIIFGAADYAKQHAYNVLCFSGSEFSKPSATNMSRDRIFDHIDVDLIDGVILPMGALSRFITHEKQLEFLQKFTGIPVVTIASDIPGYMNVGYSPRQGIFELVEHLVLQHDVQRFSFAGATGVHLSTMIKKKFFIEALEAQKINFDERFYINSDMRRNAPIIGLENLFSTDKSLWPQAIVAGTDNQALSILKSLIGMGIRVPEDVIVTGSMGSMESLFADTPLTSILEPTYELGWHAAERLVATLEGRAYEDSLVLPTSLLVRRSCGCHCPSEDITSQVSASSASSTESEGLILDKMSADLTRLLKSTAPEHRTNIASDIPKQLTILLCEDLRLDSITQLLGLFHRELELSLKTEDIFLWGKFALCIHSALMQRIAMKKGSDIEAKIAAGLFYIVQACNEKAGRYRSFEAEKYVGIMREIGIQLNSEFNLDEISQLLAQGLNINDCYISIFEGMDHSKEVVSNILAMREGHCVDVCKQPYPVAQLMPPDIKAYDDVFALLIMPLSFKEEFLGLCVLSMDECKGVVYEGLLTLFSSALKNRLQMRNLRDAEEKFSDIAHSASDWLWEIDDQAHFKYCSDGVEQVLGYAPEDLIGKTLVDFLAQPEASYGQTLMQLMNAENGLVAHECCYRHKNGSERVLLTTGKAIIKFDKIIGYRGAYKDISKLKVQEARILALAYRDPLTDLPNRTLFNDRLNIVLATALRSKHEFAVLFIDLDGFKLVNDSMGHDAGDLLLVEVATLFTQCVREGDTLARFGGDEFVVILPTIDSGKDATRIAERMINTLFRPIEIRDQSVFITASIGISIFPGDGQNAETLLKSADKAMYSAKKNGKNRFDFYESELEDALNRTVMIRNLMHTALRDDGFQLMFQPQINEKTRQVYGVEALIRLSGPQAEHVGPAEFIPLAEEIGLIDQIGLWVFKTACQYQRQWADAGYALKCSINVSAKQFQNANLADKFINIMNNTGVDPAMIVIEITENAVFYNEDRAREILDRLSDHGVSIAIDDFGTGYASLSCLRKIPVDILKIDRSFIKDCASNDDNANIIAAIVMMAKSLKLRIVAEGVETSAQLGLMSKLGCDDIQGYLFSKPLAEDKIIDFVEALAEVNIDRITLSTSM